MKKIIAVIIAMAVCFAGGYAFAKLLPESTGNYSTTLMSEEILQISELASLEEDYDMEVPYTSDNRKLWKTDIDIPFSQKSMTAQYSGIIKMGPDMEGFTKQNITVSEEDRTITVTIPKSQVLSHEIDEDSWVLLDKKNGLFNFLKPEDDSNLRKYAKKQALKELDMDKLLAQADSNAQEQIKSFLEVAYPDMTVTVVTAEAEK